MKRALPFVLLLATCGCVNVERLNSKLQEGNATYSLDVPTWAGRIYISRANPTIGFSATAGNVSQNSPTNIALSVAYHTIVPSPTMPQPSTNQVQRTKP